MLSFNFLPVFFLFLVSDVGLFISYPQSFSMVEMRVRIGVVLCWVHEMVRLFFLSLPHRLHCFIHDHFVLIPSCVSCKKWLYYDMVLKNVSFTSKVRIFLVKQTNKTKMCTTPEKLKMFHKNSISEFWIIRKKIIILLG